MLPVLLWPSSCLQSAENHTVLQSALRWATGVWEHPKVLTELACYNDKMSLDMLIDLAICLVQLIRKRQAY